MIFVRFEQEPGHTRKFVHFVGKDMSSIMEDTKDGTGFGGIKFLSYREVNRQEVESVADRQWIYKGIHSVRAGLSKSYYIG